MSWRVCSVLAVALVALALSPTPEAAAASGWWDTTLRVWPGQGTPQTHSVMLAPGEGHDRYAFAVEPRNAASPPSVGFVQVRHTPSGDIVCQGPLSESFGIQTFRYCDALRVNHAYMVTIMAPAHADVALYGVHL